MFWIQIFCCPKKWRRLIVVSLFSDVWVKSYDFLKFWKNRLWRSFWSRKNNFWQISNRYSNSPQNLGHISFFFKISKKNDEKCFKLQKRLFMFSSDKNQFIKNQSKIKVNCRRLPISALLRNIFWGYKRYAISSKRGLSAGVQTKIDAPRASNGTRDSVWWNNQRRTFQEYY